VACWQSFSDLLFQRFFGHIETSVSMASGTGLLNRFTCEWDQLLTEKLGLSVDALPNIAPERETFDDLLPNFARRWPQLAGARWALAIGDGAANNVGAGCVSSDRIALMIGTSGAMRLLLEGKPPERLESGLWCYRLDRNRPVVGGALSDGGGLYAWLINALKVGSDLKKIESELSAMLPDQHGLTLMPFWTGERSTGWHEDARGAILGLTLHTRPVEILRAAMEAIAYRFALITEALTRSAPDASIIASGGALNASPTWTQILSDVIGRPLILSVATEASSRGAALYALETIGAIESIASAPPATGLAFNPGAENHERYRAGLARQQAVYERLVADETMSRLLSGAIG
jgi:gluconokinase